MKQTLFTLIILAGCYGIWNVEYIAFSIEHKAKQLQDSDHGADALLTNEELHATFDYDSYDDTAEEYIRILNVDFVEIYTEEKEYSGLTYFADIMALEKHYQSITSFHADDLEELLEDIHHHYRINQGCHPKTDLAVTY